MQEQSKLIDDTVGFSVKCKMQFEPGKRGRKKIKSRENLMLVHVEPGRVPRVSRLMALAIHLQDLIDRGEIRNFAALARVAGITRARATQIIGLLLLAPDIQEKLLFLPKVVQGREVITERKLREIVKEPLWSRQMKIWEEMFGN